MNRIKNFVALLSGFRKLFLTFAGLLLVAFSVFVMVGLFVASWYYNANLITGDHLATVLEAAMKYASAIVGVYAGANICVKGIREWLAKGRKR